MRIVIAGAGLALMLALAGCERGAPEADDTPIDVAGADASQEALLALDEGQRNATFIRAIRDADADLTCQSVESSAYVGEHEGLPMWTARCADGTDWALLLGPDATTQVMLCEAARQAGLPDCATRPTA